MGASLDYALQSTNTYVMVPSPVTFPLTLVSPLSSLSHSAGLAGFLVSRSPCDTSLFLELCGIRLLVNIEFARFWSLLFIFI